MAYQSSILITRDHRCCSILHLIQAKKATTSLWAWQVTMVDTAFFMFLPLHSQEPDEWTTLCLTYLSLLTFPLQSTGVVTMCADFTLHMSLSNQLGVGAGAFS